MSGNRFRILWRISAFHGLGNPHELFDVGLLFRRFHLVVAPVVYHGSHHQHRTAGTGKVTLHPKIGMLQRVKHFRNGLTRLLLVTRNQIVECLQLGTGSQPLISA